MISCPPMKIFITLAVVFFLIYDTMTHKFAPQSVACIFLGNSMSHKGFRCLNPTSQRIYITRQSRFDELNFPLIGSFSRFPQSLDISVFCEPILDSLSPVTTSSAPLSSVAPSLLLPCVPCTADSSGVSVQHSLANLLAPTSPSTEFVLCLAPVVASTSTTLHGELAPTGSNRHSVVNQAKAGVLKPKHHSYVYALPASSLFHSLMATKEPKGFKSTAKDPG